jgi:hypothetical protein
MARVTKIPDGEGCGYRLHLDGAILDIPTGLALEIAEAVRPRPVTFTFRQLEAEILAADSSQDNKVTAVFLPAADFQALRQAIALFGTQANGDADAGRLGWHGAHGLIHIFRYGGTSRRYESTLHEVRL